MKSWFVALLLALAGIAAVDAGTTRITGSVVDEVSGSPLPDARIVVFAVAAGKNLPPGQQNAKRLDIRPGADGRFAVDLEVPWSGPGRFYVIASARGHVEIRPKWMPRTSGPGPWKVVPEYETERPVDLTLRLKRGPTLVGTVTDEDGRPISGARLVLTLSGADWVETPQSFTVESLSWPDDTVSDDQGHWEMLSVPFEAKATSSHSDGGFVITVDHDRYMPLIVTAVERMPAKDGVITLSSTMRAGRSVEGRVVDSNGQPVPDATLEVLGLQRPGDPGARTYFKSVRSGKDGRFTIDGLDDRTWMATATAAGRGPSNSLKFTLRSRTPLELRLLPGVELSGRLLDEDGRPMKNTAVFMYNDERVAPHLDTRTGDDGRFRFPMLAAGTYTLGAYNLFEREVTVPGPPVEVRLEPARQLIVTLVRKEDGQPIKPPASLHIRSQVSSWLRSLEREDGTVDIGYVRPAEYTIYASVPGRALGAFRARVLAGKKEPSRHVLEVPLGFTLRGQVRDREGHPVQGAKVTATGVPPDEKSTVTDAKGVYEINGLSDSYIAMGSGYLLFVQAEGFAAWHDIELFVRLGVDRRKDITLDRGATIRGRVVTADGKPADHVKVSVSGRRKFMMADYWVGGIMPSSVTDADGRYVLEHVPLGDITLQAESASKNVTAEAGKDLTVDWTL